MYLHSVSVVSCWNQNSLQWQFNLYCMHWRFLSLSAKMWACVKYVGLWPVRPICYTDKKDKHCYVASTLCCKTAIIYTSDASKHIHWVSTSLTTEFCYLKYKFRIYHFLNSGERITMKLCTCHDSTAVVKCANFRCDLRLVDMKYNVISHFINLGFIVKHSLWSRTDTQSWLPVPCQVRSATTQWYLRHTAHHATSLSTGMPTNYGVHRTRATARPGQRRVLDQTWRRSTQQPPWTHSIWW